MGIVSDLVKVLPSNESVRVYPPDRFSYGFDEIVAELGLYNGPLFDKDTFYHDIDATGLFPGDRGSTMIEMVILPTCENE